MEKLKRRRGVVRTTITKLIGEINTLLGQTPVIQGELEEKFNLLTLREKALQELNREIEPLVDETEIEDEMLSTLTYEESISVATTRVRREFQRVASLTNEASSVASDAESRDRLRSESPRNIPHVRLPKLEIPKYHGDVGEWQSFWDQFEASIGTNDALSPVDKLKYLRTYVVGKAEAVIRGIPVSGDNYRTAVDLLKKRYGQPAIIINEHLSYLLNIRPITTSHDVSRLRVLCDDVTTRMRSLENLGVTASSYSVLLHAVLQRALPPDLLLMYNRTKGKVAGLTQGGEETDPLKQLMDFLEEEVASKERCLQLSATSSSRTPHANQVTGGERKHRDLITKKQDHRAPQGLSASALNTEVKTVESGCVFCGSSAHTAENCTTSMTIEQRKTRLRDERRCFRCTKKFHLSRNCKSGLKLSCQKCSGRHLTVMCDPERLTGRSTAEREPVTDMTVSSPQFIGMSSAPAANRTQVLLQTARVWARGQETKTLRVLIDGGSQRTFIRKSTSDRLRCRPKGEEELTIFAFGESSGGVKRRCRRVEVLLGSLHGSAHVLIEALEVPEICGDIISLDNGDVLNDLRAKGMMLADWPSGETDPEPGISILIGADCLWRVTTGNVQRVNTSLTAVETTFGWTLQGPIEVSNVSNICMTTAAFRVCVQEVPYSLSSELRAFWELESLGIKDPTEQSEEVGCREDIVSSFMQTLKNVDGMYEVRLPWKFEEPQLMDNKAVAVSRLTALLKRLRKSKCLLTQYDKTIREFIANGFAERVAPEADEPQGITYYMPHRAVYKENSQTTKVRIVFDASSHAPSCASLNEVLHVGPNLNPELLQVLLNFRRHSIAITADIEKAFLQISLARQDRDALRFLWFRDTPRLNGHDNPMETWRMTRVPFGASCSPFLLAATVRHHLEGYRETHPVTTTALRECLYVDDLLTGADTPEDAGVLHKESCDILGEAGMRLCKWHSNDVGLDELFHESKVNSSDSGNARGSEHVKLLGLLWDKEGDRLAVNVDNVIEFSAQGAPTKRNVLQTSARIFDPLGLIAPVVVTVKILFQRLWEEAIEWDSTIPQEILPDWLRWRSELSVLRGVSVPRRYTKTNANLQDICELHLFSDASPRAYGAVAYLRTSSEGSVTVTLVMSKSRVAPLKHLSLPRLELMGALLAARLHQYLVDNLKIRLTGTYLWVDSNIALYWIRGSAWRWKPFVANRVTEIQRLTDPDRWRHCPGSDNPADLLTRGLEPSTLLTASAWWNGPEWLTGPASIWPGGTTTQEVCDQTCPQDELKISQPCINLAVTEPLIAVQNYSSFNRVLRVTAWVLRFAHNCSRSNEKRNGYLTATELTDAEKVLLRQVQREGFAEEISLIHGHKAMSKVSPVCSLGGYLDGDGLLRVGGRLQKTHVRFEEKHPIILHPKHHFTELLIRSAHERLLHAGVRDTLTHIREKYWILRGRQAVKKVIKQCVTCDRLRSKAASEPTAPLPEVRVCQADPFEVTGLDFAGPLHAKESGNVRKCYILVFTCAVTRAVHLELVSDMTTDNFLLAFRRFISRRGVCRLIISDNAKTFKKACSELNELWSTVHNEAVSALFSSHNIQWQFIVERAAWWGGFWERMVRSVKTALKKVLGKSLLKFEELCTVLTEVEAVINSRPLTFIYSDISEPSPLTPAHFLVGKRLTSLPPPGRRTNIRSGCADLRGRWRFRETLLNHFWKRWQREYLNELHSAHHSRPVASRGIRVGDLVIIHEHMQPRQCWKTGQVTKTFIGRDGRVRSCEVRQSNGNCIKRPIRLLYPLESLNE